MPKLPITVLAACAGLAIATPVAAQDQSSTDQAAATIDPARLAAAKQTVDFIFPAGTYAKMMMSGRFRGMMNQVTESMISMPLTGLVKSFGLTPDQLKHMDKAKIADVMQIMDPAYKQRMNATMDAMMPVLTDLMAGMEPSIREGLANAYARHFTLAQLNDMNRFFATPSGTAYASNAVMLQMDPEVIARESENMPKLMQQFIARMPEIMKQSAAATADLPKAKKFSDLTPEEKTKLAKLLGADPKNLEKEAGKSG